MAKLALRKCSDQMLVPVSDEDQDFVRKLKTGEVIHSEFRKVRNPKFHNKFFALMEFGYDYFEPQPCRVDGMDQVFTPEKNRDEFRRWVTVKAGYYHIIGYPDGGVRLRAKSLSFRSMDQQEFEQLYSAAVDVLLRFVLDPARGWSREQVDAALAGVINFDGG